MSTAQSEMQVENPSPAWGIESSHLQHTPSPHSCKATSIHFIDENSGTIRRGLGSGFLTRRLYSERSMLRNDCSQDLSWDAAQIAGLTVRYLVFDMSRSPGSSHPFDCFFSSSIRPIPATLDLGLGSASDHGRLVVGQRSLESHDGCLHCPDNLRQ
jgi:hypothetical protein